MIGNYWFELDWDINYNKEIIFEKGFNFIGFGK